MLGYFKLCDADWSERHLAFGSRGLKIPQAVHECFRFDVMFPEYGGSSLRGLGCIDRADAEFYANVLDWPDDLLLSRFFGESRTVRYANGYYFWMMDFGCQRVIFQENRGISWNVDLDLDRD